MSACGPCPVSSGDRYVMVNIPAAEIEAVENGRVRSRHTAVVGKIDRQTPILNSKIYELNFNPYWTVPVSIIRKDLIPKMKEDPEYLAKNNIRIFDWSGNELNVLAADRLEHGRSDQVPLHPGSGCRRTRLDLFGSISTTSTRSICTIHRPRRCSAKTTASTLQAVSGSRMFANW